MGEGTSESGPAVGVRGPDDIRREIDELRSELGETVEALTAKADVKAQAREKVEEIRSGVRERTPEGVDPDRLATAARRIPLPVAVAGALLLGFVIGRAMSRE